MTGRNLHALKSPRPETIAAETSARRRPQACIRCRRRKVRCDGALPACSNCTKVGVECLEGRAEATISRGRLHYLENRVRELEANDPGARLRQGGSESTLDVLQLDHPLPNRGPENERRSPGNSGENTSPPGVPGVTPGQASHRDSHDHHYTAGESPAVSVTSRITRDQPLAHEVGMISLSNASDPKYLGPSSGVTFARLIYESAPQSQGLPLSIFRKQLQQQQDVDGGVQEPLPYDIPTTNLPSLAHCHQYAEAYFLGTPFYPFLAQDTFYILLSEVQLFAETSNWNARLPLKLASAQVFLVLSLGAQFLETKLNADFSSRSLFLSGMACCTNIDLHDSIEGVQILLLMVLHSFYNPDGLNAWYLLHTIIASCLDLGLQRRGNCANVMEKEPENHVKMRHLRSAIFWTAYSIDRTLTTILGRPLTLRDEAIDQSFPGLDSSDEVDLAANEWYRSTDLTSEKSQTGTDGIPAAYMGCIYSLRFDRIVAETKLMLYRVSRSPRRFPWLNNPTAWQKETENACCSLLQEIQNRRHGRHLGGTQPLSGTTVQLLELKYHQCIMLLFRPSPQIPSPSMNDIKNCFTSAMEIIRIYTELRRFSSMECTWLSAHAIFVAAITVLYCVWTHPIVKSLSSMAVCLDRVESAVQLLSFLSRWWTVAYEPCEKLSRLISLTREGANSRADNTIQTGMTPTPMLDGEINEAPQEGNSVLIDELGNLRDLFDLEWLDFFNLDATNASAWDSEQVVDSLQTTV